ncbi:uncharacterized protein FIBRA_08584 [Fibroporia radiculosa]|uniref:Uncharacterized protein n=1 Tax=Fibroporia radiculosa TaxID=599839 RepID=J4ICF7_9APHY|nr:uncharacterized protein FIBRA_08584 [Fibroporia radiculosa]CCM06331.1 predicted protein [Fibroporia radiculosa]
MAPHPDEALPAIQLSLADFNEYGQRVLTNPNDEDRIYSFVRYMLGGRYDDDDELKRIYVNARQGLRAPIPVTPDNPNGYIVRRDYDSVIGVTRTLPFKHGIAVYPLPPFKEAMTSDMHLSHEVRLRNESVIKVPLHKIPNIAFGKLDVRGQTNLFFPALYRQGQRTTVDKEIIAKFYNKVLRPALAMEADEQMIRWPATYDLAMKQAKDTRGEFHFGTVDVGAFLLEDLEIRLIEEMDKHREFCGAFWVHTIRGIKGRTAHNIDHVFDRGYQLKQALSFLDMETSNINYKEWYIDIGIEVFYPQHVLQWLRNGHTKILQHVLPSASRQQVHALYKSQDLFKVDYEAQLTDFAGFRATPNSRGVRDGIVYIQAYSPAKHGHYQMHSGIYRRRNATDTLPSNIKALRADCGSIYQLFATCRGNADPDEEQDASARLEARVRLDCAENTLTTFAEDLVNDTMIAVPIDIWWHFKMERVAALSYVFESLQSQPSTVRIHECSLALGAMSVYILNALLYRPGEQEGDRELAEACAMFMEEVNLDNVEYSDSDDAEEYELVPVGRKQGLYFFADIVDNDRFMEENHFRLAITHFKNKSLSQIIAFKYGVDLVTDLEPRFGLINLVAPMRRAHPTRLNNRAPITASITDFEDAPPKINFGFEERGIALTSNLGLHGNDVDIAEEEEEEDENEDELTRKLTNLWYQMFVDLMCLAPNRKNSVNPSYCSMPKYLRMTAKPDLFQQYELPFYEVNYKVATGAEWSSLFDCLFPKKTAAPRTRKLQNYPLAKYWNTYIILSLDSSSQQRAHLGFKK